MENEVQPMTGIQKLKHPPVEIDLYLEYEEDKTKDEKALDRWKPKEDSKLSVWLHPLTRSEWTDTEAVYREGYRHFIAKGAEEPDASWKANREQDCQQLFFTVRKGPERNSPRVFLNEEEVVLLPYPEVLRVMGQYNKTFVPTKEEQKNSLRERLGVKLGTPSTSPNTSETHP